MAKGSQSCSIIRGLTNVLCCQSLRSVSTPGAVQRHRLSLPLSLSLRLSVYVLGHINAPSSRQELCPGKGVTSAAEIAPPHISARHAFGRGNIRETYQPRTESLFCLTKRTNIIVSNSSNRCLLLKY